MQSHAQVDFKNRWAIGIESVATFKVVSKENSTDKTYGAFPNFKISSTYFTKLYPVNFKLESGWNQYSSNAFTLQYLTNTFKPGLSIGKKLSVQLGLGLSSNLLLASDYHFYNVDVKTSFDESKRKHSFGVAITIGASYVLKNRHLISLGFERNDLLGTQFTTYYNRNPGGEIRSDYSFHKLSAFIGYSYVFPGRLNRKNVRITPLF